MSRCNNCLQGLCRKHPLQDHGERESALKQKARAVQQNTLLNLLQTEIKKLEAGDKGTSASELESYKVDMTQERRRAERGGGSTHSSSASLSSSYAGLNPAVAQIMSRHHDEDGEDREGDSSSERGSKRSKKSKKEKKSKKDKKDKKSKKRKRDRSRSRSGADQADREGDDDDEEEAALGQGDHRRDRGRDRQRHRGASESSPESDSSEPASPPRARFDEQGWEEGQVDEDPEGSKKRRGAVKQS